MDPIQYQRVFNYLNTQILPEDLTNTKSTKQFKNFCKPFSIKNNLLYRQDKKKKGSLLRVVRKSELEPVLYMMHNDPTAAHFSTDIMFHKIRTRYFWPQMYEDIRTYVKTCDTCQRREKQKNEQLLHPIQVYEPFYQVGIDFVGPLPITTKGNRYIIVAMDYMTKWPEARAVPQATAKQTIAFIYDDIIC